MNMGDKAEEARKRIYVSMARKFLRDGQRKAAQHLRKAGFLTSEIASALELPESTVRTLLR